MYMDNCVIVNEILFREGEVAGCMQWRTGAYNKKGAGLNTHLHAEGHARCFFQRFNVRQQLERHDSRLFPYFDCAQ